MKPSAETTNLILKARRVKMGLSQTDMAQMINMRKKDYSAGEDNKKEFKMKSMIQISKVTGMSMEDLFG
jgi:DNA-binding XRE family transcriptional regulator